ncbi:MAG: DUF6036 family nucleotidyltransferase [Candidatus Thorarchaeota archaeon]
MTESSIDYVLIGGLAATIFGRPRTTMDIDVIIENNEESIKKLQITLRKDGFDFNEDEILIAINEKSHCSIFHNNFPFRIDLQGIYSPLDERSFQHRIEMSILDLETFIEKPEDLIVAKLVYGSQRDLEDAKGIFLRQGDKLDLEYIRIFAAKEGVNNKLDQILEEIS